MIFVTASEYKEYLNPESIKQDEENLVLAEVNSDEFNSSILITTENDYKELITIDLRVKFKHHDKSDEGIFQREFSIEHHPENKSRHEKPHLQFHIHGFNPDQKIGKLWLTLDLDNDEEYESCIKGFFSVLEDIADSCNEQLDDKLLNKIEISKLSEQRTLLLSKVKSTLETKGIECHFSDGEKEIIFLRDIGKLTSKDKTLIPLLSFSDTY